MYFMSKRKAFTLIELLVVISIIAVLMAVMLPSLSKARESAKKIVCLRNLKSIGEACYLYAEANDGYQPLIYRGMDPKEMTGSYTTKIWFFDIAPYVGGDGINFHVDREEMIKTVFYCPMHPKTVGGTDDYARVSYGMNAAILCDLANDGSVNRIAYTRFKMSKLWGMSNKVFIGDKTIKMDDGTVSNYPWIHYDGRQATDFLIDQGRKNDGVSTCHNKGTNFLMYDGHTENIREPYQKKLWSY